MFNGFLRFAGTEIGNNERAVALTRNAECPIYWLDDKGCGSLHSALGESRVVFDPPTAVNLATNPSFESASGSTVEVARNLIPNPAFREGLNGWVTATGGGGSVSFTRPAGVGPVPSITSYAGASLVTPGTWWRIRTSSIPVTPGKVYTFSCWVRCNEVSISLRMQFLNSAGASIQESGPTIAIPSNVWGRYSYSVAAPDGAAYVYAQVNRGNGVAGDWFHVTGAMLEESETAGEYFDGEVSFNPDSALIPSWTGTPNDSPSVLKGAEIAVEGGLADMRSAVQSTRWALSGSHSLRLIPRGVGGANGCVVFKASFTPGLVYTAMVTLHLESAIGHTDANARRIEVRNSAGSSIIAASAQAPNEPGTYPLRVTWTASSSNDGVRLNHRGPEGSGDMWWDNLLIIEGEYDGPYFDGNTVVPRDPEVPSPVYRWTGAPNASTSEAGLILPPPRYEDAPVSELPWYDPRHEASQRFLGVYITRVQGISDSTRSRETVEGITNGGTAGRQRFAGAQVRVNAWLTAQGMDALEYGMSWLESALDGDRCSQHGDACNVAELEFFTACPPERSEFDTDEEYAQAIFNLRRFMHGVSAVSGPLEVQTKRARNGIHWGREVEFTLYAESPWVYAETRRPAIAISNPVVIEDVVTNRITHPSMELSSGTVVVARNYATNPSVETNATGWSGGFDLEFGPAPTVTSGRVTGELQAVASFRTRVAAGGSSAGGFLYNTCLVNLPTSGDRFSFSIWSAGVAPLGGMGDMAASVIWLTSSSTQIGSPIPIGETDDISGAVFSARGLVRPSNATMVRVRVQCYALSSGTFDLYSDALAVTVP